MANSDMHQREPVAAQPLIADDDGVTPWAAARNRLQTPERYRTYWLSTVRPDGRPHAMPVLGIWLDGAFYFITGEATRKGKNLARNSQCVMTVGSTSLPALDLVIEGEAAKVTDDAKVRRVVDAYKSELDWPLTVHEGAVFGDSAPTAGPPPYAVFELTPTTVFGFPGVTGTDEKGQGKKESFAPTRWRF